MFAMIFGALFWIAGTHHVLRVDARVWRDPERADRMTAALTGFPLGTEVRRGLVRGTVLNTANMFLLGTSLMCGALWEQQGAPGEGILFWSVLACVGLTLVSVVLGLAVIWFNVPTRLVPPHMRDEVGLVTRKLRERNLRRS
ncbi:hypothetical protein [Streptomyces sp. LUP47B]|uniref:hypothetical protein n=1 Tax=Streptomyces sp. LUP47B TaxID=1890286 RepID=UPI00085205A5|nr:hypothetical protein [Streptomyces sp. LUP47B]